jgi:CHAT domain-containing protein
LETLQPEIDKSNDAKIVWQAHIERAQTFAALGLLPKARHEFEAALNTSNAAREKIKTVDYALTYFSQLLGIYQSYVQFLAAHNQPNEALRVAESGHARLLAEKLNHSQSPASLFNPAYTARAKNAVILSYSVAPERSYGWATTASASRMFPLPSAANLAQRVGRHNQPILDQRSIGDDEGGLDLYQILIGPVADLIPPGVNVIVIPDGPLANLNFETLIPPVAKGSAPRYWLESVVVTMAPSLTLLRPALQRAFDPASLLLVGNAIQADPLLKPLGPIELQQIDSLYRPKCRWLFKAQATPQAFLHANPAQYSLIHFSTHAMPNRQSPLDSYLVLSPEPVGGEYKLFAHDLANLKLNANLVTLSACQSAGSQNVPGEGLVGLTWAVLSAGAQNVIASLWSVGVTPTSGLMGRFYTHLHAGETPAQALHAAKLEMIKKARSNPYGWAAFQLYSL